MAYQNRSHRGTPDAPGDTPSYGLIESGTYAGNGSSQNIALGFSPKWVTIAASDNGSSKNGGFKHESQAGNNMIKTGGGLTTGTTITTTGFTVDTDQVNSGTVTYYWVAFG